MRKHRANSHDNPAADTVQVPQPDEFEVDISTPEKLVADLKAGSSGAEVARAQIRSKKW